MRSIGHDCAAKRRAPVIGTLNIDFGAAEGQRAALRPSARGSRCGPARAPARPRRRTRAAARASSRRRRRPPCGAALALARRPRRRHVALVGVGAQHAGRASAAPRRRRQRVVHLEVDGVPAVVEALDEVHLPQRPVAGRAASSAAASTARAARGSGPGCGSALRRTWCSRSNSRSVSQPHCPSEVIERRGRFWNSGATSSSAIASSNMLADVERVGAVGRLEQLQAADVHRVLPRLGEQEHRARRRHRQQHGSILAPGGDCADRVAATVRRPGAATGSGPSARRAGAVWIIPWASAQLSASCRWRRRGRPAA